MNPQPTGRLDGNDLILTRSFRAPIEDVWTSITDPASTARWFGHWEGEAGEGKTIRVKMTFEKGDAWTEARIDRCDRPNQLALTTNMAVLDVRLKQNGDTTVMTFVHHLTDELRKMAGDFGPGWEYYLDNLVAMRANEKLPDFDDYYPSQKDYYVKQL